MNFENKRGVKSRKSNYDKYLKELKEKPVLTIGNRKFLAFFRVSKYHSLSYLPASLY
jgi:hypothetical protein